MNIFVRKAYRGNCTFIFGMPRGGTTWLAEYLSTNLRSVYIHEPLGLYNSKVKKSGYNRFEYFSSEGQRKRILNYVKELTEGIFNSNIIKNHQLWGLAYKKNLVLKFIKGSSLINDLAKDFSSEKFILLTRNPVDVISSQMKYGDLSQFYAQEFFNNPNKKSVSHNKQEIAINNTVEILAYTYGLNYSYLRNSKLHSNIMVISYEELVDTPKRTISKISTFLNKSLPYNETLLKKESASTYSGMTTKAKNLKLTDDEVESIWGILKQMEVDLYLPTGEFNSAYFG